MKDTKKEMVLSNAKGRPIQFKSRYESEFEMTQMAARGDPIAKRDLISMLLDQVRRTISYLARQNRDAEDLAQLALIQILLSAGSFRGDCTLKYWADRITVRTAMKQFRKRQRREKLSQSMGDLRLPDGREIDETVALKQIRVQLSKVLQNLSHDRRTAVVLHHVHGYGISEIADMTDAPVNTVRDRLRIGRKQLRKRILADPSFKDWINKGGAK
ncbi:MAG: RNA polymerase sigma factor [Proteobacteria bacterium]|nr:RNA polymerase sigma factor [Pseudomonadota bacterium]